MRRIDSWIGLPLVRILGWLTSRPRSLYGDVHLSKLPERVICAKFIGLGSVVLSLPLVKALKESGTRVAFWSFPGQAELIRISGLADEIWVIKPSLFGFLPSLWKSFWAARRFRAQAFLDLEPTANFTAILARTSGAKIRVGFMSAKPAREALFTHLVSLTPERHMVENNLWMGRLIGLPGSISNRLPAPTSIGPKVPAAPDGSRRIVVNVNSSDLSWHRMWPEEHWVKICESLLLDPGVILVFPGAPSERARVESLVSRISCADPSRLKNISGRTTLVELLHELRNAALVVSVDSGIMHMGAWVDAPVVGLFGPETPRLYAPRTARSRVLWASLPCSPCLSVAADKVTRCNENVCMKKITSDRVLLACQSLLNQKGSVSSPEIEAA